MRECDTDGPACPPSTPVPVAVRISFAFDRRPYA